MCGGGGAGGKATVVTWWPASLEAEAPQPLTVSRTSTKGPQVPERERLVRRSPQPRSRAVCAYCQSANLAQHVAPYVPTRDPPAPRSLSHSAAASRDHVHVSLRRPITDHRPPQPSTTGMRVIGASGRRGTNKSSGKVTTGRAGGEAVGRSLGSWVARATS
jgi:hypothetical protein